MFLIFILSVESFAMDQSLQQLFKSSEFKEGEFSILIQGDETKNSYELNSNNSRIPASLSKLVVAGMAYHYLEPNFVWTTKLLSLSEPKNEILKGDLCLYGGGNPSFLTEQAWVLANNFLRSDIRKIEGDLIVDESYFDKDYFSDTRMSKRQLRAYDAPVSGASFNWNSVNIYLKPGKIGEKAKVYTTPELNYVRLKNKVIVHKGRTQVQIKRLVHKDYEEFVLTGKLSHLDLEKVFYRPVQEAGRFTGENFKENLEKLGVSVKGKVRVSSCAAYKNELASVDSKELALVIRDMMKYSNNFLAEILSKTIVREKLGVEGSLDKLAPLVADYLKEAMNLAKDETYVYRSVSGLSYKNRFSAKQLFNLLNYEKLKFSHFYEFASSLPIGGIDGTLKSRFKGFDSIRFRAKTGLLNNVVSLAGYGQTKTNKNFQFVLIYNGQKSKPVWKVQQFFDKILIDYVQKN